MRGDGYSLVDDARGGADDLDGGADDDELNGDAVFAIADRAVGGNDTLRGGTGDDKLYGDCEAFAQGQPRGGDDLLLGEAGNDRLVGDFGLACDSAAGGGDTLDGGTGNDDLWGDFESVGGEEFSGSRGTDTFVFGAASGLDTIHDFEIGKDILDFTGFGGDPDAVLLDESGRDLIVDLDGTAADVQEVRILEVTAADFVRELVNGDTILF